MSMARSFGTASVALAGLLILRPLAAGAGSDLATRVEAARSAADHEAIAGDLEKKAKEFEEQAAFHRELAEHYDRAAGYAHNRKPRLAAHCGKITAALVQAAEEARRLAGEHHEIAAEERKK